MGHDHEQTAAHGVLERHGDRDVLRYERRLPHPVERVWQALTDPEQMLRWWGAADLELVVGGRFVLRWLNTPEDGEPVVMHATITRLEPPTLLETSGDVHGVLRWELQPDDGGTLLTFTSTLALDPRWRTQTLAGWHWHLDALDAILAGGSVDLVNVSGWDRVHERYVARLNERPS